MKKFFFIKNDYRIHFQSNQEELEIIPGRFDNYYKAYWNGKWIAESMKNENGNLESFHKKDEILIQEINLELKPQYDKIFYWKDGSELHSVFIDNNDKYLFGDVVANHVKNGGWSGYISRCEHKTTDNNYCEGELCPLDRKDVENIFKWDELETGIVSMNEFLEMTKPPHIPYTIWFGSVEYHTFWKTNYK